jgi:GntR family transcriptional repressor for pyruvate dehydrogenase complex
VSERDPDREAWAKLLVGPRRAYEDVAHELLVLIMGGQFERGQRLPSERRLAEAFGVSRPTVREALNVLEGRGLVRTRVGSGTFVTAPSEEGAQGEVATEVALEFLEARLAVEVVVTRLAAKRAPSSREDLDFVRATVEALERPSRGSELPADVDRAFHRAIAEICGNAYLVELVAPVWEALEERLYRLLRERGWGAADTARAAAEHRAVFEALRVGDSELAGFAMERHLRAEMARLFDDADVDGPPPRFFA